MLKIDIFFTGILKQLALLRYILIKTGYISVNTTKEGINMSEDLSVLEKMLNDNNKKKEIKVKKLNYKMDFGTTEVVIKIGLN